MNPRRAGILPLAAAAVEAACAHTSALSEAPPSGGLEPLAEQVVIYRDAYGIPHVHGETDVAAVFGLIYAHAEDALHHIEGAILYAIGRLAERDGERALGMDLRARALETAVAALERDWGTPFVPWGEISAMPVRARSQLNRGTRS